jgi:hypothetical protein
LNLTEKFSTWFLACHHLAEEQPETLLQCRLAADPRLIALFMSHPLQITGEQIKIWPLLVVAQFTSGFLARIYLLAMLYQDELTVLNGFFVTQTLRKQK